MKFDHHFLLNYIYVVATVIYALVEILNNICAYIRSSTSSYAISFVFILKEIVVTLLTMLTLDLHSLHGIDTSISGWSGRFSTC